MSNKFEYNYKNIYVLAKRTLDNIHEIEYYPKDYKKKLLEIFLKPFKNISSKREKEQLDYYCALDYIEDDNSTIFNFYLDYRVNIRFENVEELAWRELCKELGNTIGEYHYDDIERRLEAYLNNFDYLSYEEKSMVELNVEDYLLDKKYSIFDMYEDIGI